MPQRPATPARLDRELGETTNRLAIAGTLFLAISMSCALFLVTEVVYGGSAAGAVAAGVGALFLVVWYVIPLVRRTQK